MKSDYKKKGIKVTTTGDSYVVKSHNATVSHKSSSSSKSSSKKATSPTPPPNISNPNYDSKTGKLLDKGTTTAPTPNLSNSPSAGGANSETPTSPNETTSSSPNQDGFSYRTEENQANIEKFGITDEEQRRTVGETLMDEWNYYKPVVGLALWESGAIENVIAGATNVVSTLMAKYGKAASISWAEAEMIRTGEVPITESAGKIIPAITSKTMFQVRKLFSQAGYKPTTATFVLSILGGKVFSDFQLNEAMQALGYVRTRAMKDGDEESLAEINAIADDLTNQTKLQKLASFIPAFGALVGTSQNAKALQKINKINLALDEFEKGVETDDEKYARIFAERDAARIADQEADDARYARIIAESEQRTIDNNAAFDKRLADQQEAADKRTKEKNAEFDARLAQQIKDSDARQAARDKAREEYYEEIYAAMAARDAEEIKNISSDTYEPPSNLNFGLI